jgi:hypothetical protein
MEGALERITTRSAGTSLAHGHFEQQPAKARLVQAKPIANMLSTADLNSLSAGESNLNSRWSLVKFQQNYHRKVSLSDEAGTT